MKHAIGALRMAHQQIQARARATEHVIEVAAIELHAFGFARRAGSVDDRDHVAGRDRRGRRRIGRSRRRSGRRRTGENVVEQNASRQFGPCSGERIAERGIAGANERGLRVAQHRGKFRRRLARVKRHGHDAFGH
jgi:hypothetical protein